MEYRYIKTTGYCPEQNHECTVEVKYRIFTQLGNSNPNIDKIALKCPYQCPRQAEACPLYQSSNYPEL